jgi:hypothetical protein
VDTPCTLDAKKAVAGVWRDLINLEKDIVLDSLATACMAPMKVNFGQQPKESDNVPAKQCLQTRCSQQDDDVKNSAIAPVHSKPRFLPGDFYQTLMGEVPHTQRHLQLGEQHPRM